MPALTKALSRLDTKRQEQTPQALARLAVAGLFIGLWVVLWAVQMPMPVPFLLVLIIEIMFFVLYWRLVFALRTVRTIEIAHYGMLAVEIVIHTTMVYFLGGISWLGAFAYVFGLIFTNTFLDMRKAFIYTAGASLAFVSLILLDATGTIPYYVYLEQGALRYTDTPFVATTIIGASGLFFRIFVWVEWFGRHLRQARDTAIKMQDELLQARVDLQRTNDELEGRVKERTALLELANAAFRDSEHRLKTVVGNAPVILFALDAEGTFTMAEGKALDDLGIESDAFVGRSAFEMFEGQPDVLQAIHNALAGESGTAIVGTANLFEAQLTPQQDEAGNVVGVIGVAVDISERSRAAALLSGQQRVLEMIAVGAPLPGVLDSHGEVPE